MNIHRFAVASAAILLMAVPAAAAPEAAVTIAIEGDVAERGELLAAAFQMQAATSASAPLESLLVTGAKITADEFRQQRVDVDQSICGAPPGCPDPSTPPERHAWPRQVSEDEVKITLDAVKPGARIHIFPAPGRTVVAQSDLSYVEHYALNDVCLSDHGIDGTNDRLGMVRRSMSDCGAFDPDQSAETELYIGPNQIVTVASDSARLALKGDFIIEIQDITLDVSGQETWDSGRSASDHPVPGSPVSVLQKDSLFRVYVTDGELEMTYSDGWDEAAWVTQKPEAATSDAIIAVGQETLRGDYLVALEPRGDFMDVDLAAASDVATPVSANKASTAWIVAAGASIAAGAAVLVARRLRSPSMDTVESALEQGDFDKAAKLSSRILRRRPMLESAHLSRAIAWARGGRPQLVVAELDEFLSSYSPKDGTLHYVLGLAHLDLGDRAAAREAMERAVLLTPELLDELSPDLRPRGVIDGHAYS